MKVSVIGVGAMGAAMAGHLVRAGHEVTGYDIDPGRADTVTKTGAVFAESLEDAAAAELYIVMVVSDLQSIEVVEALSGLAAPGALIAIAATNHPETMRGLADTANMRGLKLIDAPVCFGLQGAVEGRLVSLCGGSEADVEYARPVLSAYSREVYHVGPLGAGQLAKACNNMLHWAACVANFEVLLLAKRFGLDAQRLREILLECPGRNGTLEHWDSTRFTWPEKDMDIVLDMAQSGGLKLPLFGQVDQLVKLLSPDHVHSLLYGADTNYLGETIGPLPGDVGGIGS